MNLLTIFTPSYNRAYILPKLYESLKRQTDKRFEWVIVDDGSVDDTESLVNGWINESLININYQKQQNQGKHIAINTFSKEYLVEDVVSLMKEKGVLP